MKKSTKNISIVQERFAKAREFLGISQNAVAKKIGLTSTAIHSFESGKSERPNWDYGQYLIENGINYFYLIGQSEEIKGQLVDTVSRKNYEILQTELETLKTENEELKRQLEETVSRAEFDQLAQKLETYAEIIQMLKK